MIYEAGIILILDCYLVVLDRLAAEGRVDGRILNGDARMIGAEPIIGDIHVVCTEHRIVSAVVMIIEGHCRARHRKCEKDIIPGRGDIRYVPSIVHYLCPIFILVRYPVFDEVAVLHLVCRTVLVVVVTIVIGVAASQKHDGSRGSRYDNDNCNNTYDQHLWQAFFGPNG